MTDDRKVSIEEWVNKAKEDPVKYLERQATEIILSAIGSSPRLGNQVYLKGGVLMGIAYGSPRQTGDLDLTTRLDPVEEIDEIIRTDMDGELEKSAIKLGYVDLMCRVQSINKRPSNKRFETFDFPAVEVKVGYAKRGSKQELKLKDGKCSNVVSIDLSFNEPIGSIEVIKFDDSEASVKAYSLIDLIAEKYRAFLQQEIRNRNRRQDIYDIYHLANMFELNDEERMALLNCLKEKCAARDIDPSVESIDDENLKIRAKDGWDTMELEVGIIPSFDECYAVARDLYKKLPW